MVHFISRRLTFILLVCVVIIFATHLGMRMIRNSEGRESSYDIVQFAKTAWGDTRLYIAAAAGGDFGSVRETYGLVPVKDVLKETYVNSLGLLLIALIGAAAAGLSIGAAAALTRHKRAVLPLLTLTIVGISVPSFFGGLLLRQGEIIYLRTFGHPLVSMAGFGWDYEHMLMPALVLAARPLAYLTRASFIALTRVMEEDYIRTAFAKGLTRRMTINTHAFRNIAIPILTTVGVSLRFSLSTLPVVEFFFAWPGMGLRLLEAIDLRQTDVVVTLAVAMGLTFLLINLLLDISYRIVDPRMREG